MKRIEEDKRIMELEYNLICDFIKLRNELGLSQQKMADTAGVVREMIAVIENRKKHPQINTLILIIIIRKRVIKYLPNLIYLIIILLLEIHSIMLQMELQHLLVLILCFIVMEYMIDLEWVFLISFQEYLL